MYHELDGTRADLPHFKSSLTRSQEQIDRSGITAGRRRAENESIRVNFIKYVGMGPLAYLTSSFPALNSTTTGFCRTPSHCALGEIVHINDTLHVFVNTVEDLRGPSATGR